MDKRKNKIFLKRAFSLMLSAVVLFTGLPLEMLAAPQSMDSKVADEDVLLLQNDSISVRMSGKNGGFYISNVEGDKTIKSDNNKDLLYHSDDYDTSFTSFRITRNGETKDYIFGGDYSFEGMKSGGVTVSQDAKGLSAKWSLGELEFTQRLELANTGSNEHGMVMINYDVQNHGSEIRILYIMKFQIHLMTAILSNGNVCWMQRIFRLRFMHMMTFTVRRQRHQP